MKFDYFLRLSQSSAFFGSTILKPIIPVKISFGVRIIQYSALIDSGADFCIFDAGIGEYLGIDVHSGRQERFAGVQVAGASSAYFHDVTLVVGGWERRATVGFSYDIAKHGYGILGQKGFFDLFVVKFDLLKEEIELKERMKQ